jgi:AcrR family transcriptional regulator
MEKAKISKKKLQAIETKKKILDAARRLISEHGFDNVSVDEIVKAAEVAKGSFYVHFESKDALAAILVSDYTNMADINYKNFLTTVPDNKSVMDVLVLLAEAIADYLHAGIGYENMRVLYKAHLAKTINTVPSFSYNRELYNIFNEILEKGVKSGELRDDIPVEILSRHLILAIRGITL